MTLRKMTVFGTALTGMLVGFAGVAHGQDTQASDEVVVTGIRKSIADSIETKREASSIVDVISAEDVGKFPDSNIADSLARLPGVTVDRQFGEGEQLSIAGVEPALNRLTIDGHSVASADWGGNPSDRSSRSFNYSLLSPTIISQAIVYKTPEARLQEGGIGGIIDVVTRKPLDRDLKSGTIAANAGYEYNDRANRGSFRGSALVNWRNQAETVGVLLAANYDKEQLSRAGTAVYWYRDGAALLENAPATATINGKLVGALTAAERADFSAARHAAFLAREFFKQERQRIGGSAAIQLRPTEDLLLTATALVIRGNYDNLSNSEYTYGFEGSSLRSATSANGVVTSATFAGIQPNAQGQLRGATGQLDTNFRRTRVKNDTFSLLWDWSPGDWSVTGNAGFTKASGGKNPEYLLDFRTQQGFTSGIDGRGTLLNWQLPASDATRWLGNFTALGGETIGDTGATAANGGRPFFGRQIGGVTGETEFTRDKEKFAEVNVRKSLGDGFLRDILFGARYSDHENSQETYGGAVYTNQNFTLADLGPYVLAGDLYDGLYTSGNGTPYATLDRNAIIAALKKYGTISVSRSLDTGSFFKVREKIAAAYAQMNFKSGQFRGNVGGRFVHTADDPTFFLNGGRFTASSDDNRFLPSANLIFDAGDTVVLRASAAKVMARHRYSSLSASTTVDDRTLTGSGGNPLLKPYLATNYGLSAEWYFAPASYLSAEVFYRDISNYLINRVQDGVQLLNRTTGQLAEYSISTDINGGKASVTGFSLSGNTNLKWGFGIQGNYTFADAQTDDVNVPGLPFLSRHTVTVAPYFEEGPFQARLSYNRRSSYFNRFGRRQSRDFADAYQQLDAQISFAINDAIQVTATAANLLDEAYYQYSSTKNAPTSVYKNGRVFSIGATLRM
ncbi:MAG: TonB-dependent receptor [Pseudomonadota bacterium]